MKRLVLSCVCLCALVGLASCGSGGSSNTNSPSLGSPQALLSANSLTFSNTVVGTSATSQSVTLSNKGTAALSVSGISVGGANAGDFAQTNTCGASVAAGGSCSISVVFKPAGAGPETASVSIADNATGSPQNVTLSGTGGYIVSGTAKKGAINGATVTVYNINADGTDGSSIGTGTTDSNGKFSIFVTSAPSGPIRVVVSGGSYTSEWDGKTVTSDSSISLVFDSAGNGASGLSVTAATTFVDSLMSGMLASGKASSVASAHDAAESVIDGFYGLSFGSGGSLETLNPDFSSGDISSDPNGIALGIIVGTLTEEGASLDSSDPDALIDAFAADISDGVWNGEKGGSAVTLGSGGPTLPTTAGTSDFGSDIGTYIGSGSAPAAGGETTANTSSVVTSIEGGIDTCGCTPAAVGLASSSSGAINSLSFGGHQYLFVAARSEGIAVVDITDPTVANPPVKLWPQLYSNAEGSGGFGGNEVGGVVPFVGGIAGHPQVLAFAYGTAHVLILNAQTLATGTPGTDNPVDAEMDVPLKATSPVYFSGGEGYIAGAVPLGGPLLGLATADGYMVFDASQVPNASAVVHTYPVDDLNEMIAENLGVLGNAGGSSNHFTLLGGNENGGVQLVDLPGMPAKAATGTSYYMTPTAFSTMFPNQYGFNSEIDGNAADPGYGVAILTFEVGQHALFINMNGASKTPPSGATLGTWAPPTTHGSADVQICSSCGIAQAAVDPTTHLALFMAGYTDDIAVGQIQDPASVPAGGTWQGLSDWSFYTITDSPSLSSYSSGSDPHADGVVYNLAKGTPYGYVLDGSDTPTGVMQIDLSGFLAISRAGPSGDAAHQPASDPATVTDSSTGGLVMQEDAF